MNRNKKKKKRCYITSLSICVYPILSYACRMYTVPVYEQQGKTPFSYRIIFIDKNFLCVTFRSESEFEK